MMSLPWRKIGSKELKDCCGMHCTPEENLECATSLLQDEVYQWWVLVTRTAPLESVTWELFLVEFRKQ